MARSYEVRFNESLLMSIKRYQRCFNEIHDAIAEYAKAELASRYEGKPEDIVVAVRCLVRDLDFARHALTQIEDKT